MLNERRRSVVDAVQTIVADETTDGAWGQAVEFHVASSIVMMMELEKRARQVALTFLPASIAVGMLSLYFSFRTWRTLGRGRAGQRDGNPAGARLAGRRRGHAWAW